ncbi:MAG: hypothetical protein M3486_05430, partial [Actinomycetota bacterium]|nr:hypothetical protein [Actinomycetota bacterium]
MRRSPERPPTTSSRDISRALLDTSVLIAQESGRRLDTDTLPEQTAISVVTNAELHAGVLAATNTTSRARRLKTLDAISVIEALPITAEAARQWASLRVRLAEEGRKA